MTEYPPRHEWSYRTRWAAEPIRLAVRDHPVLVLTGARQVGKSTLLRHERPFSEWSTVTLDDFDVLAQAKRDPASLWAGTDRIVIDEVQKCPELLSAVKMAVDSEPDRRRFVLSGSANMLLMQQVSESLAGRAVYFSLLPMTAGEMAGAKPSELLTNLFAGDMPATGSVAAPEVNSAMWRGFMPALLRMNSARSVLEWWESYVATYLERDLRQLSQIESLPDFRRLMTALALRCGGLVNQTDIARDVGGSQSTVRRHIGLLEATSLMANLPAYAVNRTKRLIKSPKTMWIDPGLVTHLCGFADPAAMRSSREAGGIFEALVFLHLSALAQLMSPRPRFYHWRTTGGKEVDFVVEWGRKLLAVEVKLADKARYSDTGALRMFLKEYPEAVGGVLIYTGSEIRMMDEHIIALPWNVL